MGHKIELWQLNYESSHHSQSAIMELCLPELHKTVAEKEEPAWDLQVSNFLAAVVHTAF